VASERDEGRENSIDPIDEEVGAFVGSSPLARARSRSKWLLVGSVVFFLVLAGTAAPLGHASGIYSEVTRSSTSTTITFRGSYTSSNPFERATAWLMTLHNGAGVLIGLTILVLAVMAIRVGSRAFGAISIALVLLTAVISQVLFFVFSLGSAH
jgi:hypothetical protein